MRLRPDAPLLGLATALSCFLLVAGPAFAQGLAAVYPPLAPDVAAEMALLHYSNLERRRAGLAELKPDEALALAARHHAQEMVRLHYFAHESPTPEQMTPALRVARAGSAAQSVGENLARVPAGAGAPQEAVQGWMDSPGHRANLLHPAFTHVGFGMAVSSRGDAYIVQVLAALPLELSHAEVRSLHLEERLVEVVFDLREARDVLIGYGEEQLPPETLSPGTHTRTFVYAGPEPVYIQAAVRAPAGSGGFIGQDGGWFDPAASRWQPSGGTPRAELGIRTVTSRTQARHVQRVTLRFARPPGGTLGVWLGETYLPTVMSGNEISVDLPPSADGVLSVAVQTGPESARYDVVLAFTVRAPHGVPQLFPYTHP